MHTGYTYEDVYRSRCIDAPAPKNAPQSCPASPYKQHATSFCVVRLIYGDCKSVNLQLTFLLHRINKIGEVLRRRRFTVQWTLVFKGACHDDAFWSSTRLYFLHRFDGLAVVGTCGVYRCTS